MTDTYLFIDTETTGFKKSGALIQAGQGRVCQIAMILTDNKGKTINQFSSLIKPHNWDVGDDTHNYYGLSYEDCERYGIEHYTFIKCLRDLLDSKPTIVAHNETFDRGMLNIENAYYVEPEFESVEAFRTPWFCTMKTNTHISPNGKRPKLDATLKHYTGKDLIDAHDAMADTKACRDIFFAMRGIQL